MTLKALGRHGLFFGILLTALSLSSAPAPSGTTVAANAINHLGLDLLRSGGGAGGNVLLSPYSIQSALVMTYAGAEGGTRQEMERVLHYAGGPEETLHASFRSLTQDLEGLVNASSSRRSGGDPITLTVANRLFGQTGYDFRPEFLRLANDLHGAPFEALDFTRNPDGARRTINLWVEERTRDRIKDLIPAGGIEETTRLVLVNALHLKVPWAEPFPQKATSPEPFHIGGGKGQPVPTMRRRGRFGYLRQEGFAAVTVPYEGGDLQFLILLPEAVDGWAAVEKRLTREILATAANAPHVEVDLHLPRFKMEPPMTRLSSALQALGMKSAFDQPHGSANFDRMAPRRPDDYLFLSEVYHKTFLALDEKGTEAAAATAVAMVRATALPVGDPVRVRVDRPFLFAIQHRPSGACLFLGRMTDPR